MLAGIDVHDSGQIKKAARYAGLCYLVLIISGLIGIAYIPNQIFTADDLASNLNNIQTHSQLYRFGMFAQVVCFLTYLVLPLLLFRLLAHINKSCATVMVILVLVSIPLSLGSVVCQYTLLKVLVAPNFAGVNANTLFSVQLLISQSNSALFLAQLFWGAWLIPLGWLIARSDLLPSWLGVLLILGGGSYLIKVVATLVWPEFSDWVWAGKITLVATLAEFSTCLWLLLGVRSKSVLSSAVN